ncbi:MAG: hypothetical protein U0838_06420 [Chloroflexota bacterium]
MTAEPPLLAGADHETATEPLPRTPVTLTGAPGGPTGTTAPEASEAAPVPTALVAVTVKVYEAPLVRPDTAHDSGPELQVHVAPPGDAVAV